MIFIICGSQFKPVINHVFELHQHGIKQSTFPKYRHSKMIFSKLQAWRVFYYGDFGDGIYRLYGDITFLNRSEAEFSAVHFRDTGEISLNTSAIRVGKSSEVQS